MSHVDMVDYSDVDSKSTSQEKAGAPLVKLSPYSDIVALSFTDQVLHVHGFLLDRFPELSNAMVLSRSDIDMSEFSSAVGHALAHFLYTGQYADSTADNGGSSYDALCSSFEVYAAASKYQLHGLREKAQEVIETHTPAPNSEAATSDIRPAEVLAVIKKAYPLPDVNDAWLQAYIKTLLDATYTDVASFLESDLMAADHAERTMSVTEMLLRRVIRTEREKKEREEQERLAAELAAKEAAEREAAEIAERERLEKEAAEQAEREAREKEERELAEKEAKEKEEKERVEREAAEEAERVAKECEAAELAEKEAKDREEAELAEKFAKECEAADLAERETKARESAERAERDSKIASLWAERESLEHKQRLGIGRLFGKLSKKERARLEAVKTELASLKGEGQAESSSASTNQPEGGVVNAEADKEFEKKSCATETVTPAPAPGNLGKAAAAECVAQTTPTTPAWTDWGHSRASRALGFSS